MPDVTAAYAYLQAETGRGKFFNAQRTVGDIYIDKTSGKSSWQLNLAGGFKQIEFALRGIYPKLKNNTNYRTWLTAMNHASYAGAKSIWISRVTSIITKHKLAQFDK